MKWVAIILFFVSNFSFAMNKSRKIMTSNDEVSEVKTALGIATKILLPENPNAAPIIGDLAAFRVELIDKGYAIKPLRYGAKTNLFISTTSRNYTVKLSLVNQDSADYIVYLLPREIKESNSMIWRDFKRKSKSNYLIFETRRIGKSKDGFIALEFTIKSKNKLFIEPEWFCLKQGRTNKVIHSLILSSREIDLEKSVSGIITLSNQDLVNEIPAVLELKYQEGLRLEIPREFLWRK